MSRRIIRTPTSVTITSASHAARIPEEELQDLVDTGQLPATTRNGRTYIRVEDFEAYLRSLPREFLAASPNAWMRKQPGNERVGYLAEGASDDLG